MMTSSPLCSTLPAALFLTYNMKQTPLINVLFIANSLSIYMYAIFFIFSFNIPPPFLSFPPTSMGLVHFIIWTMEVLCISTCIHHVFSKQHNSATDLESLLSFKAQAVGSNNFIYTNWTTKTSFCSWYGIQCSRLHKRVKVIDLSNSSLSGSISPSIANLSFLSDLILFNNSLTGHIPQAVGNLPRLVTLNLGHNFLSGPVPSNMFNISTLTYLSLQNNILVGSLPSNNSFSSQSKLKRISLALNQFSGSILNLAECQRLEYLAIASNQFSGTIPVEIGTLHNLLRLFLEGNRLTGNIPSSLGNLTKLTLLEVVNNNLTGAIPDELGNLANVRQLLLNNNSLTGSIPTALLNNSQLILLSLGGNLLSGPVPLDIGKRLPSLRWLDIGVCQLTGNLDFLPSLYNCTDLTVLQFDNNNLEGEFPFDIGNLSISLETFNAYNNNISGMIPATLSNLSNLNILDFSRNRLVGVLPSSLSMLRSLGYMSFASNSLTGSIPSNFGNMSGLTRLYLSSNLLTGSIPGYFGNFSYLQVLHLDNNKLSSHIPQRLWTSKSLVELNLSKNMLMGPLPLQVDILPFLTTMDISENQLSGNILSLGKLQMLNYLDISSNRFDGPIPDSFSGLISITMMNLSHNILSGKIPNSLSNLSHLNILDLSHNNLTGQVPKGRNFLNSNTTILTGNRGLCGAFQFNLNKCESFSVEVKSVKRLLALKYVLPSLVALIVVILLCICLIYAFCSKRKQKSLIQASEMPLYDHVSVSFYELIRATANFSEENLLGKGGFGSVFKGILDSGLTIAVKVLDLNHKEAAESFENECQVFRSVRHKNLLKTISVCSNLDFKAIVLEYMSNGNLEKWLHSDGYFINLMQRLSILVDVAAALEYLHHHHHQIVLHCDLKPTNILLDDELVAHVSDFGISKMLLDGNVSMATASMPGTIGYIAPEYASSGAVSRMGDVYSFGILMLEMFTGKKPDSEVFGEQSSLREWIHISSPKDIWKIVDKRLLSDLNGNDGQSHDLGKVHKCLRSIIELGLQCSSTLPKERIPMTDVVVKLRKIKLQLIQVMV